MTSRPLTDALGIRPGETAVIVGSGGKTSLLLAVAREWQEFRTLISTTTKIAREEATGCDFLYTTPEQWRNPAHLPGIHGVGIPAGPKLTAIPAAELDALRDSFDIVLLECDGSRRLPLKGWREDEPVIPSYADLVIGVMPVWPVGRPLGPDLAFQPQEFCRISGADLGETLTHRHLAAAAAHPDGLFRRSRGRIILFFSQVEETPEVAAAVLSLLPASFQARLDRVVAGNTTTNAYTILQRSTPS